MEPDFDLNAFAENVINTALDVGGAMHDWIFSIDDIGHLSLFNPEMDRGAQEKIHCDVENAVRDKLNFSFPVSLGILDDCALDDENSVHRSKFRELGKYAKEMCFCWLHSDYEEELMREGRYLSFQAANL